MTRIATHKLEKDIPFAQYTLGCTGFKCIYPQGLLEMPFSHGSVAVFVCVCA